VIYIFSYNLINIEFKLLILLINYADIIILTGGPQHLIESKINKYPEINVLMNIIKICHTLNKLLIGICLGSQLIALTYGMKIIKLNKLHIGRNFLDLTTLKMDIIQNDNYLNKIDFELFQNSFSFHNDGVYDIHNSYIDILAYSKSRVPYIIRHKQKPIYGFQFHPEATNNSIINALNKYDIKIDINKDDDIMFNNINKMFFTAFIKN
jgi:GMP synthase (glutamine-hydrolysing)